VLDLCKYCWKDLSRFSHNFQQQTAFFDPDAPDTTNPTRRIYVRDIVGGFTHSCNKKI
jgi:hypothetical protein